MKEAIEQFRIQLGAAIDSVEFVKRALDREVHDTDGGKDSDISCGACVRPKSVVALVLGVFAPKRS
jgi:hypothetical protein